MVWKLGLLTCQAKQFIKNMLPEPEVELILPPVVIAADEGVMSRIREHLANTFLLGIIQKGVLVLTKGDLNGKRDLTRNQEFAEGTFLKMRMW